MFCDMLRVVVPSNKKKTKIHISNDVQGKTYDWLIDCCLLMSSDKYSIDNQKENKLSIQ